jgi:hypothetical protein
MAYYGAPDWSPDGSRMVAMKTTYREGQRIEVADVATKETRLVGTFGSLYGCMGAGVPVWSPDGTRVAYLAGAGPDPGQCVTQLTTVDPDGSGAHVVAETTGASPSGPASLQWRVVNRPAVASIAVGSVAPSTGEPVPLTASVSDPDGPPRGGLAWDVDGDGFDDGDGVRIAPTFVTPGVKTIRLQVKDNHFVPSVVSVQVTVRDAAGETRAASVDHAALQPADGGGGPATAQTDTGANPPAPGAAPRAVRITAVPRVDLREALRSGMRLSVASSASGRLTATARISRREARRLGLPEVVATATAAPASAGRRTVVLRFTRLARRRLADRGTVTLTVAVRASGATAVTATRAVTLRR